MDTYVILRRSGWRTPEELEKAAERSTEPRVAAAYAIRSSRPTI